jgi:hypothetical protein
MRGKPLGNPCCKEASQKLLGRKRHGAGLAAMGIVLPAKTHRRIRDREQAVVGDSDAMSVAGQIVKDVFWSAEGWLETDDPVPLQQSAQKGEEVLLDCKCPALTIEHELVVAKTFPQNLARILLAAVFLLPG